jgi:hypothetical protein
MSLKEVAVSGMTVGMTNPAITGSVSITGSASTKVKADSKGVYCGDTGVAIAGAGLGTCQGASGSGDIKVTATKVKGENKFVLRKGDQTDTITANGTDSGTGAACTISIVVEVQDAGQTKVKAE